jgi:porin
MGQEKNKRVYYSLHTSVTGDHITNVLGGIDQSSSYIGMENLSLEISFNKESLFRGTHFFLHGLNTHGNTPSGTIVGDWQAFSNIEAGDYTGFYEYYITQELGNFTILFGQHDLNSSFVGTGLGGLFINSSYGICPSISLNVPVSIFPVAAPCLYMDYKLKNKFMIKAAVYDGDPGDFESNRYNLQWSIRNEEGYLAIAEFETCDLSTNNCFKLGGFYHTGSFEDYSDAGQRHKGNCGLYAIYESGFKSRSLEDDSGWFIQLGASLPKYNLASHYLGAGIHIDGVIPKRPKDMLGLAVAHMGLSSHYRDLNPGLDKSETSIELTYQASFLDHYLVQPNIQYILNPGTNPVLDNALVISMRFNISL